MKTAVIVRLKTDHAVIEFEKTAVTGNIALRLFHQGEPVNQVIVAAGDFKEWLQEVDAL